MRNTYPDQTSHMLCSKVLTIFLKHNISGLLRKIITRFFAFESAKIGSNFDFRGKNRHAKLKNAKYAKLRHKNWDKLGQLQNCSKKNSGAVDNQNLPDVTTNV